MQGAQNKNSNNLKTNISRMVLDTSKKKVQRVFDPLKFPKGKKKSISNFKIMALQF